MASRKVCSSEPGCRTRHGSTPPPMTDWQTRSRPMFRSQHRSLTGFLPEVYGVEEGLLFRAWLPDEARVHAAADDRLADQIATYVQISTWVADWVLARGLWRRGRSALPSLAAGRGTGPRRRR